MKTSQPNILDVINYSKIQFVCVDASYAVNRKSFRRHNASYFAIPQLLLPLALLLLYNLCKTMKIFISLCK